MFLKMDTWAKYVWCLLDTLLRGNLNSAILFDTYRKFTLVRSTSKMNQKECLYPCYVSQKGVLLLKISTDFFKAMHTCKNLIRNEHVEIRMR